MTDELRLKVSLLPESPGVYRYYNTEGTIIYVGKAKNLRRRVSSYFNRDHPSLRTTMLVRHIADLQYTVVNTEEEALDLENSLIKEFQPRYNVLLKDDKSYPWICVTKELYPRVYITRDALQRGAKYYGPYPKAEVAHSLLTVIRKLFPVRTCRLNVSRETIEAQKHRLCLQYHIHNCEGCCRGLVSVEAYNAYFEQIRRILNGDSKVVADYLLNRITRLASELRFEEANVLKRKYLLLENYRARSVIVSPTITNVDVFALHADHNAAYVCYMHVRAGTVVQSVVLEYRHHADTAPTPDEVMTRAIADAQARFARQYADERLAEVLVNIMPDDEATVTAAPIAIPQRGDRRHLLDIALKNARQYAADAIARQEKLNPEQRITRTLTALQRDFRLSALPRHIECFDNSNISGADAVASCVVFVNAKPSKRDYRHFLIKSASGQDDYAQMREVITRRYTRLLAEGQELPQMVVVDGGKGQLNAAVDALTDIGLADRIALIGIAKRLNEIYFPGDDVPLYIDKNSESLRVVQKLRDEAHRFAITHHRNRRTKRQTHSLLDEIPGIGPKTRDALLRHFRSLKNVRLAAEEDLAAVIGPRKAHIVVQALQQSTPTEGS